VAKKRRATDFLSNEEIKKWVQDTVERETAGPRKQVEDVEAVVQQEQDNTKKAEHAGLMNREPK
jgi:hypothetical protein